MTGLIYIPENKVIDEQDVYLSINQLSELLMKYKNSPEQIVFISEMMQE